MTNAGAKASALPATVADTVVDPSAVGVNVVEKVPVSDVVPVLGASVADGRLEVTVTAAEGSRLPNASANVNVIGIGTFGTVVHGGGDTIDFVRSAAPGVTANAEPVAESTPDVATSWTLAPACVSESPLNVATPPTATTVAGPLIVAPPKTDIVTASAADAGPPEASTSSTVALNGTPATTEDGCDEMWSAVAVAAAVESPPPPHAPIVATTTAPTTAPKTAVRAKKVRVINIGRMRRIRAFLGRGVRSLYASSRMSVPGGELEVIRTQGS
jgi:hypothetical protein